MLIRYVMCVLALLVGISAFAETPSPIVREEAKLTVNGVEEIWRLEWASAPSPFCSPDEPDIWSTCPCAGFAFGERGNLVLVRQRPGHEPERLSLGALFTGDLDGPADAGEAVLRRWDVEEKDLKEGQSPGFASKVRARPVARVMRFQDYDHDGKATEFAFQVGTLPCGKKMSVVVGISGRNPRLHVFGTVEQGGKPLVLQAYHWEALLKAKAPIKVVDWVCGDHGSDTETELELSADGNGIHATRSEYQCKKNGSRGRLVKNEGL